MQQVLFPFAFIAGMWLWDTVLSKIFAEGTAPYFSGISVSSSAIPFVCHRLSASGIFVGCRILGIVPAVVRPAVRAVAPLGHSCRARIAFRVSSRPVYPRSYFRSRPAPNRGTPFRNSRPDVTETFFAPAKCVPTG